jgi:hypothetical protein
MHQYGLYQVAGKTTTASGAVTAYYLRSSDDYNTQNWGVGAGRRAGTCLAWCPKLQLLCELDW